MSLVITMQIGDFIMINENIKVTYARKGNGNIRVSIDAPREMKIVREALRKKADRYISPLEDLDAEENNGEFPY